MRIMYKEQPKIGGGADSIENYLSKIWGGGGLAPPQACRWETP